LADVALAGRVIASHYAMPVKRHLRIGARLHIAPAPASDSLGDLHPGDAFWMLDDSLGWAWGYAGEERRVGYVPSEALGGQ
jgi:hypothetical protein